MTRPGQDNLPSRPAGRFDAVGMDGWLTLLLSNLLIGLSCGVSFLWAFRGVLDTAFKARTRAPEGALLVVPGVRLRKGKLTADYTARLDRASRLCREGMASRILVTGGACDGGAVTEAARGREYLLAKGLRPEHILVEDTARHTLENMRNVRDMLAPGEADRLCLVSNRYHLARSRIIARGLGMDPVLCGAEDKGVFRVSALPRLLLESYYIHWYWTGYGWSHLTRNAKSLARIS